MGSQQQVIAKPPYYPQHKQTLLTRVLRNTATASCSHSSALKTRAHSEQQFAALALPLLLRRKRQQRNFPQLAEPPPFPLPSPPAAAQPWRHSPAPPNGRPRGGAEGWRAAEGGLSCAALAAAPARPRRPLPPSASCPAPPFSLFIRQSDSALTSLHSASRPPAAHLLAALLRSAGETERLRQAAGGSSPRLLGRARSRGRTAAPGAACGGRGSRRGGRQLSHAPCNGGGVPPSAARRAPNYGAFVGRSGMSGVLPRSQHGLTARVLLLTCFAVPSSFFPLCW